MTLKLIIGGIAVLLGLAVVSAVLCKGGGVNDDNDRPEQQ